MTKIPNTKKSALFTRLLPTLKEQRAYVSRTNDAGRGWYSSNKRPVRIFIEGQP